MLVSASITVQGPRTEQYRVSQQAVMPWLWRAIRGESQRRLDRAAAQAVRSLDHEGVREDYRMACQRR